MGNMVGTQCPPWGGQMASAVRDAYEELEADHDIQLTPETWKQRMFESSCCSPSEVGPNKQYQLLYLYVYIIHDLFLVTVYHCSFMCGIAAGL